MRNFNSTARISRCRNIRGINYIGFARQVVEQCRPDRQPKTFGVIFEPDISLGLQEIVLECNDLYCRMCGVIPGDIDDLTQQKVEFHIQHIESKDFSWKNELSNLHILCSTCYQGVQEMKADNPFKMSNSLS